MDIITVVYKNYELLDMQVNYWSKQKNCNLIVCDNTPIKFRQPIKHDVEHYILDIEGIDGETHGAALDFLIKKTKTDIIGMVDSDFFWIDPNILDFVQNRFDNNDICVGAEGFNPRLTEKHDLLYPDYKSSYAPVCWGMFIDRNLALSDTFVLTSEESCWMMETGWRVRVKIIQDKLPCTTFKGHYDPDDHDAKKLTIFTHQDKIMGVHLQEGSSNQIDKISKLNKFIS